MKKRFKSIAVLMLAAACVSSLNSCKKKEDKSEGPTLGAATISGNVKSDLNLTDSDDYTDNLSGVVVLVSVSTKDQVVNPIEKVEKDLTNFRGNDSNGNPIYGYKNTYNYPIKVYSATTDAAGNYSVTIEVGDKELDATVSPQDKSFTIKKSSTLTELDNIKFGSTEVESLVKGSNIGGVDFEGAF